MAMSTFYGSTSSYKSDLDWKMDDLRSKLLRYQEIINNQSVNEEKLKSEMKKIMEENKKMKAEIEKINSRFDILDL